MSLKWYVARTTPLGEYMTRDHLRTLGVDVFLPCARSRSPRAGHEDAPLFPGYLFVSRDLEEHGLGTLRRGPQLIGLVSFDGELPPVPDHVIEELMHRTDAINGKGGFWTRFRPGEKIKVSLGPTEGLAEVVEEARFPRARVRVLMEFLGRLVEAEVPWTDVQPAGHHTDSRW